MLTHDPTNPSPVRHSVSGDHWPQASHPFHSFDPNTLPTSFSWTEANPSLSHPTGSAGHRLLRVSSSEPMPATDRVEVVGRVVGKGGLGARGDERRGPVLAAVAAMGAADSGGWQADGHNHNHNHGHHLHHGAVMDVLRMIPGTRRRRGLGGARIVRPPPRKRWGSNQLHPQQTVVDTLLAQWHNSPATAAPGMLAFGQRGGQEGGGGGGSGGGDGGMFSDEGLPGGPRRRSSSNVQRKGSGTGYRGRVGAAHVQLAAAVACRPRAKLSEHERGCDSGTDSGSTCSHGSGLTSDRNSVSTKRPNAPDSLTNFASPLYPHSLSTTSQGHKCLPCDVAVTPASSHQNTPPPPKKTRRNTPCSPPFALQGPAPVAATPAVAVVDYPAAPSTSRPTAAGGIVQGILKEAQVGGFGCHHGCVPGLKSAETR